MLNCINFQSLYYTDHILYFHCYDTDYVHMHVVIQEGFIAMVEENSTVFQVNMLATVFTLTLKCKE